MFYSPGHILLNKYRIETLIGKGAFGDVYRAAHLDLGVQRALKVLRRDTPGVGSTEFDDCFARFELEARLGARLDHPNLVRVYDFEHDQQTLILVMEYCPGGSLAQRLDEAGKTGTFYGLEIDQAVRIALEVAQGLAALHALDAVHRDLKPSNILFDAQGRAKLGDLGLAQIRGGPSMRSRLSQPNPHPGTPGYMSPEQTNSTAYIQPPSDIYALGLVLFEMLTGRACSNQRPGTRASSLRPEIPSELDELLMHMLAKDPEQRPWNGAEAAQKLEAIYTFIHSKSSPIAPKIEKQAEPTKLAPVVPQETRPQQQTVLQVVPPPSRDTQSVSTIPVPSSGPAPKVTSSTTKWLAGAGVLGVIGFLLVIAIIAVMFISNIGGGPSKTYSTPTAVLSFINPSSTPRPTATRSSISSGNTTRPTNTSTSQSFTFQCPGSVPSRLKIGQTARVVTNGLAPQLALIASPNLGAEQVHVIAAGRQMVLLEGPICADSYIWWLIRSEQGFEGWIKEGDSKDYWVEPVD